LRLENRAIFSAFVQALSMMRWRAVGDAGMLFTDPRARLWSSRPVMADRFGVGVILLLLPAITTIGGA